MDRLARISREELLLQITKLKAENALLKQQLRESGKSQAHIDELEYKLKKVVDEKITKLTQQLEKAQQKIKNQRQNIQFLYNKLKKS